jgi:putative IMPACT (imprinted ancient) family translation regulator
VVVVVTRYFGGTKLGTGGLVRAYTEAVKKVLEVVELAEKVATHAVLLVVPYNLFEQTRLLVDFHRGRILNEEFATDVTIKARFREERWPDFQGAFTELSHGRLSVEIVESNSSTIMPLEGS